MMKLLSIPLAVSLVASAALAQQPVPDIRFDATVDFLKLPPNVYFGEVAGVAIDARRHVYVFSRTGTRSTLHGQSSAQLFEFGPDGAFIKEIGKDLYGFAFAHTVRVDKDGNLWATDEGTNMIMKFNPAGKVLMVLGRRAEAVEEPAAAPAGGRGGAPRPGWGTFNRPTDVAWDLAGNVFIADGYNNSRVVKVDKNGRWVKTWGDRGTDTGQFNILHSIANDAKGNIYVADRTNRRIQVFDPDGKFLRQFTIDVPFTKEVNVMAGAQPGPNSLSVSGAPWAICITPPPNQVLYSADAVPGRIYKLTLDGKVLGVLGEAGKELKQFGWIHEIACPSENELYVAELLNWRVQRLVLHP
jgi:DNA-binding beta-propeller fold protein YncE